jgi:biotin carboxyl carrier protein
MIRRYLIELGGREHELSVEALADGRYRVTRGGASTVWDARRLGGSSWSLLPEGGGRAHEVDLDRASNGELSITSGALVGIPARVSDPLHRAAERAAAARPAGPVEVKSPMPGKVVRALVKVGDSVTAGQAVVVVEAMKMENELKAPRDGKVRDLRANDGQAVEAGQPLVVLE